MIYLDYNATTPLDPRVLEVMLPFLRENWGNASSRDHRYGWDAQDAVEQARFNVAALIHCKHNEIFFTSGATESIHLALHGLFKSTHSDGRFLVTTSVEHESVLGPSRILKKEGHPFETVSVDDKGNLNFQMLQSLLASGRVEVFCALAANNETGVLFPIRECAELAHRHGALFLMDATQAVGKISLDAELDSFDIAAFSAHKIYGPKGVGALYMRGGASDPAFQSFESEGSQESGVRPGTLNVAGIVGFGEACRLAALEMQEIANRVCLLRDHLEASLRTRIPGVKINGNTESRLPNTANLQFPHMDARAFIRDMNDVAVSTRSACSSSSSKPSHVLVAMGLTDEEAFSSVRFSLGKNTTREEIDTAVDIATASYQRLLGLQRRFSE